MMRATLLGLLLACAAPALAADLAETPGEFAAGMQLHTPGNGPFYRLALPFAVYTQARPDLADVRVFNADGQAVPYALEAGQAPAAEPVLRKLPFFPVRGDAGTAESLDMKIEQGRDGRIIALTSRSAGSTGSRTVAYLLDLSALKQPVQALQLEWPASPEGYSAEVRLEASDDLREWRTLTRAQLLDMRFGGHQLQQKRIAFAPAGYRYLRLTADRPLPVLRAALAEALPSGATAAPEEQWQEVRGEAGDRPGEYLFALGAHLTATRLQVRLPETNMLAPVELLSRRRASEEWQPAARTTAYRLWQDGSEVVSPPLDIPPRAARYWLLRLDPRAGAPGAGLPVLRLAWTPQQLVFLARGKPPFTLAFGQRDAKPAQLPLASLVPAWRPGLERALPQALPGPAVALGGYNAPQPGREDQPPADWKRWLLWGVLLAGVALLAAMARGLMRQLPSRD